MQRLSNQETSANSLQTQPNPDSNSPILKNLPKKNRSRFLLWSLLFLFLLGLSLSGGALAGYYSGTQSHHTSSTRQANLSLQEQYDLGVQDLAEGQFEVARQRFEYIIAKDPSFPGVTEKLAESMAVLYATATPTLLPPTVTATPTQDMRPVEDLFTLALDLSFKQMWKDTIDTLLALRKADPIYKVARVDGLLFISLRQQGIDKIWKEGNLEGGSYDLALAERFGPLDAQAISSRELARLYMIGSSFWEVYPEQAVNYFNQVAAAAPGLRDASGWTASERYRESLIHYGNQLATNKDWCNAQQQYELALAIRSDAELEAIRQEVALKCSPPTSTPLTATETASGLLSPTPTPPILLTATNTIPVAQPTDTPTLPISPPSETPIPPPSDTLPPPTETPIPPYPLPSETTTSEASP